QTLYFVGNHREAAARIPRHGGLDGGVKGEDVGLIGNVGNQRHDIADLLGAFTQTLDPLGGVLDLLADGVHALDVALHHVGAVGGNTYRAVRNRGGLGGVGGHLVDGDGHFVDRRGGAGNFLGLVLGGVGQLKGGAPGFRGRRRYALGGVLDPRHQFPQLENGEVDGVGDGAGKVFGHRRFGGQVTVTQAFDFVEETENRLL